MRFYKQPHAYYCGVDLHARSMFTHILDQAGNTVFAKDLPADPDIFLDAIAPFRSAGIVVGCECMFAWYWLADLCEDKMLPFTLGHALYMKLIHGGKSKNDRLDAGKIAALLRGGMFPMAYVYPRDKRATRDLLRRRCHFVEERSQLLAHIVNTNSQYNLPALTMKLCYKSNRSADFAQRFKHPAVQHSVEADLKVIDTYEEQIKEIERFVLKTAKIDNPVTLQILRTTPGIGKILSLVMLYEIDNMARFPEDGNFLSYARLVRCEHESAGKKKGSGGKKIGNAHLKWAFSEAACLMLRAMPEAKKWMHKQERKRGKRKALAILEAKIGRSVYHMWRKQVPFDPQRFFCS